MEEILKTTKELLEQKEVLLDQLYEAQGKVFKLDGKLKSIETEINAIKQQLLSKGHIGKFVHISKEYNEIYMKVNDVSFDDDLMVDDLTIKYKGKGFVIYENGIIQLNNEIDVYNYFDGRKFEVELISEEEYNDTFKKTIEGWIVAV